MTESSGYYIYGICKAQEDLKLEEVGLKNEKVYQIKGSGLAAIVSNIDEFIVDPVEENVLSHQKVLVNIMEKTTILPMSFGNVFKNDIDIKFLLKKLAPETKKLFLILANRVELGLKIFWNPEKVIAEIGREYPYLKKNTGGSLSQRISIGKEISMYLEKKKQIYLEPILKSLTPLAVGYKENELVGNKMILNAAFLVNKDKEIKFDQQVDNIYEKYNKALEFRYSGPWPPYSFTNINIKIS